MQEKQVIVDGTNVCYYQSEELDRDNALVFLHGWGSEALHLKTIFGDCANFVALDLPGFGKSDLPPSAWTLSNYARVLKQFLAKLEIRNPVLVGHSIGGSIVIKYLAGSGDAKKAILISPAGIRKRGAKIFLYLVIAKALKIPFMLPGLRSLGKKIRPKFYKMIDSEDYIQAGNLTATYQNVIREDLSNEMKNISVKTTLIWGADDKATPLEYGKHIAELINGSTLRVIENAGHFSFLDQPEKFREIFLEETNDY